MTHNSFRELDPSPHIAYTASSLKDVKDSIFHPQPGVREFATLLSPVDDATLELMAQRAQELTRRFFGRTISLYVPLYLSNFCSGGCDYCGFAADRRVQRRRLEKPELIEELSALQKMGFEETLLLTGERCKQANFNYLREAVALASQYFHQVTIETFAMSSEEYGELAKAGCYGMTIYQETYDPEAYLELHRWGPKRDYDYRLAAPQRALSAGMRAVSLGTLLGLAEPLPDLISLYLHLSSLKKKYWDAGMGVSLPRLRPEGGGFKPRFSVSERELAQMFFAFRICLPETPIMLSTRERKEFRDGMAGISVNKMSAASKTTVGGYASPAANKKAAQFQICDDRTLEELIASLRDKKLFPVFKNWDKSLSVL